MDVTHTVDATGKQAWRVTTTAAHNGVTCSVFETITGHRAPDQPSPEAVKLAEVLVWLELGEGKLESGETVEAIVAGLDGVERLGEVYAGPDVDDDTFGQLELAKKSIAEGERELGAEIMLHVLDERASLYARYHDVMRGDVADDDEDMDDDDDGDGDAGASAAIAPAE